MEKTKRLIEKEGFMDYMIKYHGQKEAERYGDILNQTAKEEFSYSFDEANQLNLDSESRGDFVNSRVEEAERKAEEFFEKVQPNPESIGSKIMKRHNLSEDELHEVYMDLVFSGKL